MKKLNLLLLCCVFALFGNAQDIITAWTFDGLTGNNSGASNTAKIITSNSEWGEGTIYADGTNGSDDLNNQTNPEINSFTGTTENDPRTTPSASKDLAIANSSANGKSIVFKFSTSGFQNILLSYAERGSASGFKKHVWSYSTDGVNFTIADSLLEMNASTTYSLKEIDFSGITALNDAEVVYLKLTVDGCTSGSGNNRIDNVVFRGNLAGPDIYPPKVTSFNVENETTIKINFNEAVSASTAQNTENYVLEGISFTNATLSANSVTLTASPELIEGESYTLYVSNVEDLAGNVMIPDTLNFTYGIAQEFHVANIAELRNKWTADLDIDGVHYGTEVYKLTGSVIVTGINNSYRHQIFIQDETGAIVIDDNNNLIQSALEVGDEIKNIYGKLTDYYGLLQFAVSEVYTDQALSIYNDVTPLVVSLEDIQDVEYMNAHQCEFIKIENAAFVETGTFANGSKYSLKDSYDESLATECVWIHFYNISGLTGETIPTEVVNLVGVNKISYGKYYLIPRSAADITIGINNYFTEKDVVIYPNPVSSTLNISLKNNDFQVSQISVFDINGKLILTRNVSDNNISVSVNNLSAGQYFVRLSDNKNSVTTKFLKN